MEEMAVSEFNAKCLSVIDRVSKSKISVLITRRGKPVAELVPASPQLNRKQWLGSMKDSFEIVGNILEPVIDLHDFEAYRD